MKKTNKTFKRFAAITSASLLAACAMAPVFTCMTSSASDYVITVNAPTGSSVNAVKEVKAYKIFNLALGDYDSTKGTYGAYTYTVDDSCVLTADQLLYIDYVGTTAAPAKFTSIEELVSWIEADSTGGNARIFADKVYTTYKTELASATSSAGTISEGVATIDTGSAGYYMVYGVGINKDGESTGDKNTVISQIMLDSTDKTALINLKLDAPSLDKQIYHDEKKTWGDVGDNQIGENVEYKIITSVPDITGYTDSGEKYKYVIHDSMTDGLSFNADSLKVYTDAACTSALNNVYYTLNTDSLSDGCDFELTIDLNTAIKDGALEGVGYLYTCYNALLTSDALVADKAPDETNHNDNEAYLQYSNNPYATLEGSQETGETPKVEVYDWTFSEKITKVNEENTGLAGAIFEVYTVDPKTVGATPIRFIKGANESYTIDSGNTEGAVTQITSVATGGFVLRGLDDATTYYIKEVQQPDGYALLTEPKTFTLEAGYIAAAEGAVESPDILQTLTDGDTTDGANEMKIVNTAGSALPGTGGIGTTIFYLGGGAMAAIGGVYLISKRRMKKSEE